MTKPHKNLNQSVKRAAGNYRRPRGRHNNGDGKI